MFDTLLIANRGEIACRIAATAKQMGIRTVAVYSDADRQAAHVQACDMAVHLGGPEPRDSYLKADAIIAAARRTGAQAIHPGYGFLAENADFALACEAAGITFVGPSADAIRAMGSKVAAKALMEDAGVPLVPGYHGSNQDPAFLQKQADAMGYPVLIKASAGGGGKGMRIVHAAADFAEALLSCQREAAASFGDDTVLVEKYLLKPRHIEIQVFADTHGQAVYLFERDCSVQRRYQKVIEEAPAPHLSPEQRQAMGEAAVAAARAVDYVGAGTVEFIAEPDGTFYFMEMNTRLQVEHPVTELITGHDLVAWQLLVAAGQPLPARQADLSITGHAIEARVYAENPDNDFLPATGQLSVLAFPPHVAFENGPVRIDGGVRQGDTISPYYDPMIAKVIVHGRDRNEARMRMVHALGQLIGVGVHTNVSFLQRLMLDDSFAKADLDTGLIERRYDALFPAPAAPQPALLALATAALLIAQGLTSRAAQRAAPIAPDPWDVNDAWRLSGQYQRDFTFTEGEASYAVAFRREGNQQYLVCQDQSVTFDWQQDASTEGLLRLRLTLDGQSFSGAAVIQGSDLHLFTDHERRLLNLHDPARTDGGDAGDSAGGLVAPMPGKVISIDVAPGDTVNTGDRLLVMEAMKMEHTIQAPFDGTIEEIYFAVGDQVEEGAELIAIQAPEDA